MSWLTWGVRTKLVLAATIAGVAVLILRRPGREKWHELHQDTGTGP